jgi:hypothetical protein
MNEDSTAGLRLAGGAEDRDRGSRQLGQVQTLSRPVGRLLLPSGQVHLLPEADLLPATVENVPAGPLLDSARADRIGQLIRHRSAMLTRGEKQNAPVRPSVLMTGRERLREEHRNAR